MKSSLEDLYLPRLLDQDHVAVRINGREHSLTLEECYALHERLSDAIRMLEYNQELRDKPYTVYCKVCNAAGVETQTHGLWGLPEGWGWVMRNDDVINEPGRFCACPEHKE